jgi:chromatin segregation and condensation protein Rec8/ScpA/Scc1 (kleisin family)
VRDEGKIDPSDLDLVQLTDSPAEACRIIAEAFQNMQCPLTPVED